MKTKAVIIKRQIIGFIICTFILAGLNIMTRTIPLLNDYGEFRVSGFFSVFAGMFFGPSGALGCAVGNFLSDLYSDLNFANVCGFLANFLFAWLPYRLWHTLFPVENHKLQYITSNTTLLKYIFIIVFSTVASMSLLSSSFDILGICKFNVSFTPVVLYDIYFALFWGTTTFLIVYRLFPQYIHIPYKVYNYSYNHKRYLPDYIMCLVIIIAVIFRILLSEPDGNRSLSEDVLDAVIISFTIVLAFLPIRRSGKKDPNGQTGFKKSKGLQSQIITVFFLFIAFSTSVFASMLSFDTFNYINRYVGIKFYLETLLVNIFKQVNLCGFLFILLLMILLNWIEKRITRYVIKIADTADNFVENGLKTDFPKLNKDKISDEILTLASSYKKMSSDIAGYIKEVEEHTKREENIRLTIDMAAKIQAGILPKPLNDKNFSLSAYIKPAKIVGGDFYDYIKLDDDRLLLCIADVSSKGIPAAMFMALAGILVKCNRNLSPEKILYNVNNYLCETNSENMFVTMFVGIIDRKKRVFEFANAGHNYPIIKNGGEIKWLKAQPDLMAGVFPEITYHLNSIDIKSDFEVFVYTDGINEAEDLNSNFFGNERLEKLFKTVSMLNAGTDEQLKLIIKEIESFTKGAKQSDDITAMIIKINE